MEWEFDSDRPLYIQLVEKIQTKIVAGEYKPGEKMPSVRELATQCGVNPNTMQRALASLEQMGLLITKRTTGRVVADNAKIIQSTGDSLACEEVERFVTRMKELGFNRGKTVKLVEDYFEGGDKDE